MLRPDARMHLGLSRHGIADRAVLCRGLRRIVHDAHNRPLRVSATIGRYSARCAVPRPQRYRLLPLCAILGRATAVNLADLLCPLRKIF